MALPRFQGVRKLDGLGISLADLLKELNELRNREPEKYKEIVEVVKPIFIPEYIPIVVDMGDVVQYNTYISEITPIPTEYLFQGQAYIQIYDFLKVLELIEIPPPEKGLQEGFQMFDNYSITETTIIQ